MNLSIDKSKFNEQVLNHPAGLFILFFTEMWERFSYYGMRALLVMFLVSSFGIGGWEWSREEALALYGTYTGLVYITPILGGILADKFLGFRNSIAIGALVMTLGHASMALETETFFYLGLGLLILGNGFFKPCISSMVGGLYKDGEQKKDAGYTIFYMGINAGAFLGILLCGYIGEKVSWSFGFGLAGIFMFFGLLQFWFAQKFFGENGAKPSIKKEISSEEANQKVFGDKIAIDRFVVILVLAFFTIFFWMAFEQAGGSMTIFAKDYTQRVLTGANANIFKVINTIITVVPMIAITGVLILLFKSTFKKIPTSNLYLGLSFLAIWAVVGWMLVKEYNSKGYELEFNGTEKTMVQTDTDYKLGDKLFIVDIDKKGKYKILDQETASKVSQKVEAKVSEIRENEIEVTASWFGVLNSLFIILFAPLFSKLWEKVWNPSAPIKFALGFVLLGLGFAALAYGALSIPDGAKTASVSMAWLIIAYFMHTMGELAISPVGLSYVSKLSPKKIVGLMFGIWFVCNAIANKLAGVSGEFIDKISKEYGLSSFFLIFTIIPMTAALLLILLNKILVKKMHGVK